MASIAKLSIRGVRAFSPNDDEQVIGFCFPLTIIVGANGCGKTTIIESLKYAVTGSLPPGNKSGQSFVHDPRSMGQSSVKASIKLRFTNIEGSSMVVARSMEVTQKKTTASFKALDGTIRTTNKETGERVTMSHKCTELDKSVPMYLGVSKPILEHVVFCHQEDASWPLQEGAVLKKRFDDIFDSTRYAKALEAIKAERKSYASLAKDLKADLEGLSSHKHAATGFKEEMEECKDKISGLEDKMKAINDDIEKERAKAHEASKVIQKIEEFETDMNYKLADVETQEAVLAKQKELLGKDDLTDKNSYQELKEMLRELSDQRHGNEATRSLEEKEREYADTEETVNRLRKKTNDLNSKKGKLEAEREAHTNVLRARFKIMEEIHRKHNIEMDSMTQTQDDDTMTQGSIMSRSTIFTSATSNTTAITQEDMDIFQRAVEAKNSELTSNYTAVKDRHRAAEDDMQKKILDFQSKKAAIDNDRKRNETMKNDALKELQMISSQMQSSSHNRVRPEDVEEAKEAAAKLAKDRDSMNTHPRREAIVSDIRVQEEKLKDIASNIEKDTKVRDQLRAKSDEQNEIDMLEKQVNQEYDTLKELLQDNSYMIAESGESVTNVTKEEPVAPVEVLHNNIRNKKLKAEEDMDRYNKAVGVVQKKLSEKKASLNGHKQRYVMLDNKKTQLLGADGGVQKIKSVVRAILRQDKEHIDMDTLNEDSQPTAILKWLGAQLEQYSAYDEKLENITKIIKRLKKMAKTELMCPCCTREFANEDEINTFQARMTELGDPDVSELHAMATKKAGEVRAVLDRYEKYRKTVSENMHEHIEYLRVLEELKEVEAIIAEEEGGGGINSLQALEADLKKEEEALAENKELLNKMNTLMSTVSVILDTAKRVWSKLRIVKEKKEKLKFQLFDNLDDARDLKTVEKDLERSNAEKEAAYNAINGFNNEQKKLNEQISRITNQAATAENTARDKEDALKREQEASKKKSDLNVTCKECTEMEHKLEEQLAPLRRDLLQAESDRERMRNGNAHEDKTLGEQLKTFERDLDKLNDVNEMIQQYVRSNKDREFEEIQEKLRGNKANIQEGEENLAAMKPQLESLKKQVDDGERQLKTIQDNIDVFKLEKQLSKLRDEIKEKQAEYDKMGINEQREIHQSSASTIRQHQAKLERYNGRLQGFSDQKRSLKRKLAEPEYKGVDERHRMKMIEHETTTIVVTDLDKYYDALDKALLRFHALKIADINKIIKELWALTYKGEDITDIQIQSGQDTGSRANRSYNYRIVMSKGNSQMDMRGRCSAGQRVLASLVIRLALAETFCLNCGVMALDEPTTNLDHENKRGLAIALAQIIASRAAQSNFQLLVITHDEDFVSMMKLELSSQTGFSMPERYYQVAREESSDGRFYSKISAIDWDDL